MTSIRGRRVLRLLRREFAGAELTMLLPLGSGATAVLGVSSSGAAFCATDGRGKYASVFKWLHGSTQAVETRFDLLKDSLPPLVSGHVRLEDLGRQAHVQVSTESLAPRTRTLVALALQALA